MLGYGNSMYIYNHGVWARGVAYNYLLDNYTNSGIAFSMFKLRSAYSGSCLRVRRSSDNTEQDIGFVNNYLDTVSLLSFVGANNGFVVKWYDQSGNANNLGQTTASNQPQIVSSGSLITRNGIAFIKASSTQYFTYINQVNLTTNFAVWYTYEKDTTANRILGFTNGSNWFNLDYGTSFYIDKGTPLTITAFPTNTTMLINDLYLISGTQALYKNGTLINSKNQSWTVGANVANMLTFPSSASQGGTIFFNELVLWSTDQTSNRSAIELDIKTRNSIY